MATLSQELRRTLENTVADARRTASTGAEQALKQLAVHHSESWPGMTTVEKALREKLRAHGKQLGDKRDVTRGQELHRLKQACAYEHWHRMLFARFLAENNLLIHPDYGEPLSLEEVKELAREQNADWLAIASDFAEKMLLEVFRADDPVLQVVLPPETRQNLEDKLARLPAEVFRAEDSLGWVYQFWQRDEKDEVNESEAKVGADELAAVTQLFTEDYMVAFLLHNTLGAWWSSKRRGEGKNSDLPGLSWTYLRLKEDGSPAAGSFDGWPRNARALRILDPCMGSGHFLASILPILVGMRVEEEGLPVEEAIRQVLSENLFGLELDARCSQIAAFNLALTAWRMVGRPVALPTLNLACSGLGINSSRESWVALGGSDGLLRDTLGELYTTFQKAPTLGSLINPMRSGRPLLIAQFAEVWPLLQRALSAERPNDESRELAIAAKGVLSATKLLSEQFTLVATNVPYLGRGKQSEELKEYCDEFYSDAKADLATCFIDRCLTFCSSKGTAALVTPQNWLFQVYYKDCRARFLRTDTWHIVARLGARAFQEISGEVVKAALVVASRCAPVSGRRVATWNVSKERTPNAKALALRDAPPDCRLTTELEADLTLSLRRFARCYQGISTGDNPQMTLCFWELANTGEWRFFQVPPEQTQLVSGRTRVIRHLVVSGNYDGGAIRGREAWGKKGVAIARIGSLAAAIYDGEYFANTLPVIIPNDPQDLPAIWAFAQADEFRQAAESVSQSLSVDNGYLEKLPFDLDYWRGVAADLPLKGIPPSRSSDPTQWIFDGQPKSSTYPLQVAVLRLLGYRWPRQQGAAFADCPAIDSSALDEHADSNGIVCLASLAGEQPAADRLRELLSDAFGPDWSSARLAELLGNQGSLETWLRDRFFVEHCDVFQGRPFVWHVWDGRRDGFHALVNYHKLAGPCGEGRQTLEKLIYTSLGDWIGRQKLEAKDGVEGADGRLAAAVHLQSELENILNGESPYDAFVRWKPIHQQAVGWEPDLNDGVRLNIRPWLIAKPHNPAKRDSCILRVTPIKAPLGKDKGKEPLREREDFPWYADSTDRNNDIHLSLDEKRAARQRRKK